jgi:hypothetical protein
MDMKEILTKHAKFYESLIDHNDAPSPDAVLVSAAVLTLAQIISEAKKD